MVEEMRDVFAGLAMQGLLAANPELDDDTDVISLIAKTSYKIADAMVQARDVTPDQ